MKPVYCIIDEDAAAADELAAILERAGDGTRLVRIATNLPEALEMLIGESVELLFIRIGAWDDYRKVAPLLPQEPRSVVFLSGRQEKCTRHLPLVLDFWLQPPYSGSRVRSVLQRVKQKSPERRDLEIFFIRENCRYHPIGMNQLLMIRRAGANLIVLTKTRRYQVNSSLAAFEERLPFALQRVARDLLIPNHAGL